jgi:hypothetical protein
LSKMGFEFAALKIIRAPSGRSRHVCRSGRLAASRDGGRRGWIFPTD